MGVGGVSGEATAKASSHIHKASACCHLAHARTHTHIQSQRRAGGRGGRRKGRQQRREEQQRRQQQNVNTKTWLIVGWRDGTVGAIVWGDVGGEER